MLARLTPRLDNVVRISQEISLGSILQLIGMLIGGLWLLASLTADVKEVRTDIGAVKSDISRLSDRQDSHLTWHAQEKPK